MARVAPARRRSRSWILVVLLLGVVGGLLLMPGPAREVEAFGSRLLEPLQGSVSSMAGQIDDVTTVMRRMSELSQQNDQYREEIDRLQSEIARLRELEVENRDLRNLLGLKQRDGAGELLPVRVIARDPSPFVQAITLDRGSDDGVKDGMTIITWRGVVGRVSRVSQTSSKVLLITDTSSSISGRIQSSESRVTGIVKGRPEGGLIMQRIPQEESLQTGETVVTSDFGGLMPEGLVIGQIVQIRRKDVDVLQEAVIEPSADMKRLERLYVLVSSGDRRQPTMLASLIYAAVLVLAAIAESTVGYRMDALGGGRLNLVLVLVAVWSLLRGVQDGMLAGLVGGLALDFMSGTPFGLHTMLLGLLGAVTALAGGTLARGGLALLFGTVVLTTAAYFGVLVLVLRVLGRDFPSLMLFVNILVPTIFFNALAMPFAAAFARRLDRSLSSWRRLELE